MTGLGEHGDHAGDLAALCDAGLFLRALGRAAAVPFEEMLRSPALAREIARVLHHTGAHALSDALSVAAFRRSPRDATAQALYLREVCERRGALEGWLAAARLPAPTSGDPRGRARLALARAAIHVGLRDHEGAGRHLDAARELDPIGALEVDVARHLHADRVEEALALVAAAPPEARSRYGVVLARADLLASHDRLEDAVALLREQRGSECSAISAMQLTFERELERHAEAEATYAELVRRMPLADREARAWLDGFASELAYARGDREESARLAEACGTPFHRRVAAAMRAAKGLRRVRHHVQFVRQDWMTCAPATLTALSSFFGRDVEHDAIANAICYDGTPSHAQRKWAEEAGFACRELTVTWDAAVALLDAGLPFALTTVEAGSAHIRAVVGYDEARRTLLFRETQVPILVECLADELFDRYRAHGPRGLVIARGPAVERLAAMTLPDAERYDLLHQAQVALDAHERAKAAELLARLSPAGAPSDAITLAGARVLASYDGDGGRLLEVARQSVATFPEDPAMRAFLAGCLEGAASHEERARALEAAARLSKEAIWDELLGAELATDARRAAEASRWLRRGARHGSRPRAVAELGVLAIRRGDGELGRDLLKLAYCIDPLHDGIALALARELSAAGRVDEATSLLARRHEELGARSAAPTVTFLDWLAEIGDDAGRSAAIDLALARRPQDGVLACAAAAHLAAIGERARATEVLARFDGRARRADHLRATARLHEATGDVEATLEAYRALLEIDPADASTHAAFAAASASRDGARASLRYLDSVAERHPYDLRLAHARAQMARAVSPEEHDRVTASIVEKHPESAWALRERALALSDVGRRDEAALVFDDAAAREPSSAARFSTEGFVLQARGDARGAVEAYRRAVAADPDAPGAIRVLVSAATELGGEVDEVRAAFELARDRTIDGAAVLGWLDVATGVLDEAELRARGEELRRARPELWAAALAEAEIARATGEPERALELLDDALTRFPRAALLWTRRAALAALGGDDAGARAALDAALRVAPGRGDVLRSLARLEEAAGDAAAAASLRARALAAAPLSPPLVVSDARERAAAGDVDGARARLEAFLAVCTDSEPAWAALLAIDAERALSLARDLAARRPWDESAHVMLAELRAVRGDLPGAIEGLRSLAPPVRAAAAVKERLGLLLADAGRVEEALAECPADGHYTVVGRRAEVLARVGRAPEARALLERVVAAHPGYVWGLTQLVVLCTELGDAGAAFEAARRLAATNPDDANVQRSLARAAALVGDRSVAVRAWVRAHRLAPTDPATGAAAMRALVDLDAVDEAREVLERLGRSAAARDGEPRARVVGYYRVEIAAVRGDAREAEAAFEALARDPESGEADINSARRELLAAGMAAEAERALQRALDSPVASDALAPVAIRVADLAGERPVRVALAKRSPIGRRRAEAAYIAWRAARGGPSSILGFVALRLPTMRSNTISWAAVGETFAYNDWPRAAALWMSGWRRRASDASAQTLLALALCLHALRRTREAEQVSATALSGREIDCQDEHRTLLSFARVVRGETANGAPLDPPSQPPTFYDAVARMTEIVAWFEALPPGKRSIHYPPTCDAVRQARAWAASRELYRLEPFEALALRRLADANHAWADSTWLRLRALPWAAISLAAVAASVIALGAFVVWVTPRAPASTSAPSAVETSTPPRSTSSGPTLPVGSIGVLIALGLSALAARNRKAAR